MDKGIMNYLHILILIICGMGLYYWMLGDKSAPYVDPSHSYRPRMADDMGFVKPEHKLRKIFESLSSGAKVKLGGVCEEVVYDKNTIPVEISEGVIRLVRKMIDGIQFVSGQEYYIKGIENLYILHDKRGNNRYIVDFFIYDISNYYTMRLLADIVVVDGEMYMNYLNIQNASSPTLLNNYDIKFDSSGVLFGYDMFHENLSLLFDNYYLKHFKVVGISDSNLEYSKEDLSDVMTVNSFTSGYFPSNVSNNSVRDLQAKGLDGYLEMYLPENQATIKDPLFCQKYKQEWDEYGVPIPQEVPSSCLRNNNGAIAKLNDPWFGPGLMYERSSQDEYKWLKERGNLVSVL